jgi:hypothetical protein
MNTRYLDVADRDPNGPGGQVQCRFSSILCSFNPPEIGRYSF